MATTIKMPQLGESVTEGTIERWLVKEGDRVEQYDPLFEVVTDKVNAEVPAEVAGTVTRIIVSDGQTVKVGTPLAEIDAGDGDAAATEAPPAESAAPPAGAAPAAAETVTPVPTAEPPAPAAEPTTSAAEPAAPAQQAAAVSGGPATDASVRMTPAVRRLVREHDLDIAQITGSGSGGRVTRDDVLAFVARRSGQPSAPAAPAPVPPPSRPAQPAPAAPALAPAAAAAARRACTDTCPRAGRRRPGDPPLADAQGDRRQDDARQADGPPRLHRGGGGHGQRRALARGEQRPPTRRARGSASATWRS